MKRLALILLMSVLLIGCGKNNSVLNKGNVRSETELLERHVLNSNYSIIVDKQTGVCYLESDRVHGYAGCGGITVMLNPDGTPKIWEDYFSE